MKPLRRWLMMVRCGRRGHSVVRHPPMVGHARRWLVVGIGGVICMSALGIVTVASLYDTPRSLREHGDRVKRARIVARDHRPISITFQNRWNINDTVMLHEIPPILRSAFLFAEDKRFFAHNGIDWVARGHAMWQNVKSGAIVRGASTITEQSVRIINPRTRTAWSRWLESFEARRLESSFSKADILEFYLNQVPYGAKRRGVVQAARYYFDRSPSTLSKKEALALAVLVRAPSRLNLHRDPTVADRAVEVLARRMYEAGVIDERDLSAINKERLDVSTAGLEIAARHFARYIRRNAPAQPKIVTTLSPELQHDVQRALDQRISDLIHRGARHGAALVVDHTRNEVLAWVVGGANDRSQPSGEIDTVTTPRQPGSTLKPFVYALALEKDWTAATLIDDSPLAEAVGVGLHAYKNYSRRHYGLVSLRDALGNSLNIPAVKALQYVGAEQLLERLRVLGVQGLSAHPDQYGDGLALGNGEVSLFELVQAYTAIANQGRFRPLNIEFTESAVHNGSQAFSPEVSSLVANILADSEARRLEFGHGSLLQFPVQTAVKTGTSSDYRDAWAVGFNHRYTVGVWMGALDRRPMQDVTGSLGPALVLRTIFARLNRDGETKSLYLSPKLSQVDVCATSPALNRSEHKCRLRPEWFIPGTEPAGPTETLNLPAAAPGPVRIRHPSEGLQLAMDPRIPNDLERFEFSLSDGHPYRQVTWYVNEVMVGRGGQRFLWPVTRGHHIVRAEVQLRERNEVVVTTSIGFTVQ